MTDTSSILSLEAGNTSVAIAPARGAIVTSFRVGGRELFYLDPATFADTRQNVRGGMPVLFPSPGKLEGDHWCYGGREGTMKQHGFARNLAWTVVGLRSDALVLELAANEQTLAQFPWRFRANLAFTVSAARLRLVMTIENQSDSPMPFGLGYHPYFLVHDKARTRIDTAATRAFDNVTKADIAFQGFDLTRPEVDLHLLDHGSNTGTLHLPGGGRIDVTAAPDFSRWVVWTLAGKDFVCLEPWTAPANAINTRAALTELAGGESRESWVEIGFTG